MKRKEVTLADIARSVGVSINAVSLALRGKNGVSGQMRRRIINAAAELGYSPVSMQKGSILILIPQRFFFADVNSSTFYHQLYFELQACAASTGYHLIMNSVTPEDEKALNVPPLVDTMSVAGVITVGNLSRDYCLMIHSLGRPYVMADQYYDDVPINCVITANTAAAYALTSHLIDRGHRSIQFFGMPFRTSSLEDRWIGYRRAMLDHGLEPPDNELLHIRDANPDQAALVPHAFHALNTLPTAFVCGHDVTAQTVIGLMAQRGKRCPDDFSVTGFDNIPSPDIRSLRLTTCDTPKKAIAETAIDLLQSAGSAPRRVQLYGELIYRESVGSVHD